MNTPPLDAIELRHQQAYALADIYDAAARSLRLLTDIALEAGRWRAEAENIINGLIVDSADGGRGHVEDGHDGQ